MPTKKDKTTHRFDPDRLKVVPLDSIHRDPTNARRGDVASIVASFERYGQDQPVVVQESTGRIIKGNHRHEAAQRLGWPSILAYFVDDDDATAIERGLADNRIADRAFFDEKALAELMKSVADPTAIPGFDAAYVQEIVDKVMMDGVRLPPADPGAGSVDYKRDTPDADDPEGDPTDEAIVEVNLALKKHERDALFATINLVKDAEPGVATTPDALLFLCRQYRGE